MEALLFAFDIVLMSLFIFIVYSIDKGRRDADDLGLFSYRKSASRQVKGR